MSKKNAFDPTETFETENQNEVSNPDATAQNGHAAATAVPKEQPVMPPTARAEPVIYCGPNIPKGNLLSMAVFRGGLPGNVQKLAEKIPEINGLIVPVSQMADMKKKIAVQGTEENRLNQVILTARGGI